MSTPKEIEAKPKNADDNTQKIKYAPKPLKEVTVRDVLSGPLNRGYPTMSTPKELAGDALAKAVSELLGYITESKHLDALSSALAVYEAMPAGPDKQAAAQPKAKPVADWIHACGVELISKGLIIAVLWVDIYEIIAAHAPPPIEGSDGERAGIRDA